MKTTNLIQATLVIAFLLVTFSISAQTNYGTWSPGNASNNVGIHFQPLNDWSLTVYGGVETSTGGGIKTFVPSGATAIKASVLGSSGLAGHFSGNTLVERGSMRVKATTGNDLAYEVSIGDNNSFEVFGNGQIETFMGLKIYAGKLETFEIKETVGGPDVFHVKSDGEAVSWAGYRVKDGNDCVFKVGTDGKVYAYEVEVTLDDFCDYVFEEDYDLLSLKELEQYIQKNKHLPKVPSAKEVDENGIGLGKLSHIQMEKIEELTLYILEMNKQLETLKKANEELQEQVKAIQSK